MLEQTKERKAEGERCPRTVPVARSRSRVFQRDEEEKTEANFSEAASKMSQNPLKNLHLLGKKENLDDGDGKRRGRAPHPGRMRQDQHGSCRARSASPSPGRAIATGLAAALALGCRNSLGMRRVGSGAAGTTSVGPTRLPLPPGDTMELSAKHKRNILANGEDQDCSFYSHSGLELLGLGAATDPENPLDEQGLLGLLRTKALDYRGRQRARKILIHCAQVIMDKFQKDFLEFDIDRGNAAPAAPAGPKSPVKTGDVKVPRRLPLALDICRIQEEPSTGPFAPIKWFQKKARFSRSKPPALVSNDGTGRNDNDNCGEVMVFGDVHGAFDNLLQLLANLPMSGENGFWDRKNPGAQLLFLGDYGDRAPIKGDTFYTHLLMAYLQAYFPQKVTLLRGNHETEFQYDDWALSRENNEYWENLRSTPFRAAQYDDWALSRENNEYWDFLRSTPFRAAVEDPKKRLTILDENLIPWTRKYFFPYLPLAAKVHGKALVIHAGISDRLKPIKELMQVDLRSAQVQIRNLGERRETQKDEGLDRRDQAEKKSLGFITHDRKSYGMQEWFAYRGVLPQIWRDDFIYGKTGSAGRPSSARDSTLETETKNIERLKSNAVAGLKLNDDDVPQGGNLCYNELIQADPDPVGPNPNARCPGLFTKEKAEKFLEDNKLELIIRGHEPRELSNQGMYVEFRMEEFEREGEAGAVQKPLAEADSQIMFIFSSPIYKGNQNFASFVSLKPQHQRVSGGAGRGTPGGIRAVYESTIYSDKLQEEMASQLANAIPLQSLDATVYVYGRRVELTTSGEVGSFTNWGDGEAWDWVTEPPAWPAPAAEESCSFDGGQGKLLGDGQEGLLHLLKTQALDHKGRQRARQILIQCSQVIVDKFSKGFSSLTVAGKDLINENGVKVKRRVVTKKERKLPLALDICPQKSAEVGAGSREMLNVPRPEGAGAAALNAGDGTGRNDAKNCGDVLVFGDVHGAFDNLLQLLANLPVEHFWEKDNPDAQLLFLGDYGDRAPVLGDTFYTHLLMAYLQAFFPQKVTLLRGNHEGEFLYSIFNPLEQEEFLATDGVVNHASEQAKREAFLVALQDWTINEFFPYLPLAARVHGKALVVHAGISARLKNVNELMEVDLRKGPAWPCIEQTGDRFVNPAIATDEPQGTSNNDQEIGRETGAENHHNGAASDAGTVEQQGRGSVSLKSELVRTMVFPQVWRDEILLANAATATPAPRPPESDSAGIRPSQSGNQMKCEELQEDDYKKWKLYENIWATASGEEDGASIELLYADPDPTHRGYPHRSPHVFTEAVTKKFLEENDLELIIRGHDPADRRIGRDQDYVEFRMESFAGEHDFRSELRSSGVMFVFSSAGYAGRTANRGSFVSLKRGEMNSEHAGHAISISYESGLPYEVALADEMRYQAALAAPLKYLQAEVYVFGRILDMGAERRLEGDGVEWQWKKDENKALGDCSFYTGLLGRGSVAQESAGTEPVPGLLALLQTRSLSYADRQTARKILFQCAHEIQDHFARSFVGLSVQYGSTQSGGEVSHFRPKEVAKTDRVVSKSHNAVSSKVAVDICKQEPKLLDTTKRNDLENCGEVLVFGDVHGTFDNLLQLLANLPFTSQNHGTFWHEKNPGAQLLFMGNYGDHAPIEDDIIYTHLLMAYLQAYFPQKVTLLRGRHERKRLYDEVAPQELRNAPDFPAGLGVQLPGPASSGQEVQDTKRFLLDLHQWTVFEFFPHLPLAARVHDKALVVDSGISGISGLMEVVAGPIQNANFMNVLAYQVAITKMPALANVDTLIDSMWGKLEGQQKPSSSIDPSSIGLELVIRGREQETENESSAPAEAFSPFRMLNLPHVQADQQTSRVMSLSSCPFYASEQENSGGFVSLKRRVSHGEATPGEEQLGSGAIGKKEKIGIFYESGVPRLSASADEVRHQVSLAVPPATLSANVYVFGREVEVLQPSPSDESTTRPQLGKFKQDSDGKAWQWEADEPAQLEEYTASEAFDAPKRSQQQVLVQRVPASRGDGAGPQKFKRDGPTSADSGSARQGYVTADDSPIIALSTSSFTESSPTGASKPAHQEPPAFNKSRAPSSSISRSFLRP
ncbi:unnamed protein product [Amoebophrya sp. A120]|nr:unnamed protein product [Amoebophrya sp. A120]|eukprot:GSA120T00012332001.1